MTQDDQMLTALEGRMLAHRRVLAQVLAALPLPAWHGVSDWLAEHTLLRDGQEDPGAVPAEGLALELSIAEEYRELAALAQGLRKRAG